MEGGKKPAEIKVMGEGTNNKTTREGKILEDKKEGEAYRD